MALYFSPLRKNYQDNEFGDLPEYFMPLSLVRDPFTILREPALISNVAFPRLPHNFGFTINGDAQRLPDGWATIETTEFMIESQGLPFDEAAMEAFRRGEPALWVWDPLMKLPRGPQAHSRLRHALKVAWAARLHKAGCVISKIRHRDKEIDRTSEYFRLKFFEILHNERVDTEGEYSTSMKLADVKSDAIESIYGMSATKFNRLIKNEVDCYGSLYGDSDAQYVESQEFGILGIMLRGLNRVEAINAAQHGITHDIKHKRSINSEYIDVLNGNKRNYNISVYEYFVIALHSGFNPQILHPGLDHLSSYLGVAAWLGRLGHANKIEMRPELCQPLLEILNTSITERFANSQEAVNVYDLLRRHAELFTGVNRLRAIAKQVRRSGYPSMVQRLIYGHVTRGAKKGSLVKFAPDEVASTIVPEASTVKNSGREAAGPGIRNEVRSFIPLAW